MKQSASYQMICTPQISFYISANANNITTEISSMTEKYKFNLNIWIYYSFGNKRV